MVSFLSRNGQQISLNDERSQRKSSSSTFAICACCLPQSHKLRNCLVQQKTLITEKKKHRGTIASKQRSTNHSSSFFSNKSVRLIGDLRIVERACPHLVPGNQGLGTGTKWCCVHSLSTRSETVFIVTPFRLVRLHFET